MNVEWEKNGYNANRIVKGNERHDIPSDDGQEMFKYELCELKCALVN